MLQHQLEREAIGKLEGREVIAELAAHVRLDPDRGCHVGHRKPGGHHRARPRKELADSRGDDAERAFGADEPLLEVVARVVLAQAAQSLQHPAIRQHHLEAEHEIAHGAVTQDGGAASIGGDVAAQLATALRTEAQREQPVDLRRSHLHLLQDAAGFRGDREVFRIDLPDAVQAPRRQHDLRPAGGGARHRASHQPGIAPLGHHANMSGGTDTHHGRHLGGARRQQDQGCRAPATAAGFRQIGGQGRFVGHHALRTDDGGELGKDACCKWRQLPDLMPGHLPGHCNDMDRYAS